MIVSDLFIYVDFTIKSSTRIEISNYQNGVKTFNTFDVTKTKFIDCLDKSLQDYKQALLSNLHMLNHFNIKNNEQYS